MLLQSERGWRTNADGGLRHRSVLSPSFPPDPAVPSSSESSGSDEDDVGLLDDGVIADTVINVTIPGLCVIHNGFLQANMYALGIEPFVVGQIKQRLNNVRTDLCPGSNRCPGVDHRAGPDI